ncbi:MAG: T9SS type A sorting domain-containing protein [Spirosoma sp.]|nr:T9SS type A sorting domain-containing protein [Spirosoma sp.]
MNTIFHPKGNNSDKYLDLAVGYPNTNAVDLRFQSCLPVRPPIYYPSARQSADGQNFDGQSSELSLQATISPNPVEDQLHIHIDGVGNQPVRLVLTDLQGRTVAYQTIQLTDDQRQATMPMGQSEPGMYLLRVSTATEGKTLKVLKR